MLAAGFATATASHSIIDYRLCTAKPRVLYGMQGELL
jgi:hypothetical protein